MKEVEKLIETNKVECVILCTLTLDITAIKRKKKGNWSHISILPCPNCT